MFDALPTFEAADEIIARQDNIAYETEMGMDGHRALRAPSSMARISDPAQCRMHHNLKEGVPLNGEEEEIVSRCKPCPGYSPTCEYYDPVS